MEPYGAYYEYHVPVSSDIICIRTYGVVLCRTGCNGGGGGDSHFTLTVARTVQV